MIETSELGRRFLTDFVRSLFILLILAISSTGGAFALVSDTQPVQPASLDDVVKQSWRIIFRDKYYPEKSRRLGQQGTCQIAFAIDATGVVKETFLELSTGHAELDTACTAIVTDHKFPLAGTHIESFPYWVETIIFFRLDDPMHSPPLLRSKLKIGGNSYPAVSREMHQEGACAVRVHVGEDGVPNNPQVVRSTGFAALDQACVEAILAGTFYPGVRNFRPHAEEVNIILNWRLIYK